jgi:hypothetical protein
MSTSVPPVSELVAAENVRMSADKPGITNWEMNKYMGELYEKVFVEILKDTTNVAYFKFQPESNFSDWDLLAYTPMFADDDIDMRFQERLEVISYEVKCDTRALETGNIAIEVHDGTKDSGLAATKADIWIHFLHNSSADSGSYYHIPVKVLKSLVSSKTYRTVKAGNGGRTTLHLLKMDDIKQYLQKYSHTDLPAYLAEKIKQVKVPSVL